MPFALKNLIIWVAIILAGWFVYSVCQGRLLVSKNLEKSIQWLPNYSLGLLNQNERALGKSLTQQEIINIRARSVKALGKAPLAYLPFVQLGEAYGSLHDSSKVRTLFMETQKRNTRDRRALRAIANLDLQEENYEDGIRNLNTLLSLNATDEHSEAYYKALAILYTNPSGRLEIDKYLQERPDWGHRFLKNQITQMTENDFRHVEKSLKIFTAKDNTDPLSPKTQKFNTRLHNQYLQGLTSARKIDEAFDYWKVLFLSDEKNESDFIVNNPNFKNELSLPPFDWLEIDEAKYFSEIDYDGGLYASYNNNEANMLTEQLLRLAPGSLYKLNVDAEWTYKQRQGLFFWIVTCLSNNQTISGVTLDDAAKSTSGGSHTFLVPTAGCNHQSLRLIATPGQYSRRIWSRTNSVNIERAQ